MRAVWAAAFLLRRLRTERGVIVMIVVLVGVTSFLAAAGPRLYNLVADAGLRDAVDHATPAIRNVELTQDLQVPPGEAPETFIEGTGQVYKGMLGPTLEAAVERQETVVTSARFGVLNPPKFPMYVTLRIQSGIGDAAKLVEGRWPVATGEHLAPAVLEFDPNPPPAGEPPTVEIAVSTETAEEAGIEVGQVLSGQIDTSDPIVPRGLSQPIRADLEVVGIVEVDPDAEIWYSDNRIQRPGADYNADTPILFVTALIAPEAHPDLTTSNLQFHYAWRYFVDPSKLDAGSLPAMTDDVRRLRTTFNSTALGAVDADRIVVRTGLLPVLEDYVAQRSASEAVLSVAAMGPFALALGAIGMFAILLVARRRASLVLARGRGASIALILGAQLWEAGVLAGAATLGGLLLALVLVPGRPSEMSVLLAVVVGLVAVLLQVLATFPAIRRPVQPGTRDTAPPVRTAPRRLVLELTAVGLAVAGIFLLRQRGLTIDEPGATGSTPVRFDPFLAAVPILAGVAAGIVATRLYPFPIRAVGWLAAKGRGLVPVLGLRAVGRRPSLATTPLLVLMLTAAFGSFALVVTGSVERGQLEASWRAVGADYRLQTPAGSLLELDTAAVPGVGAVAPAYVLDAAPLEQGLSRVRIPLVAIDAAAYEQVVAGAPVQPAWPAAMKDPARMAATGSADDPIPAVMSRTVPGGVVIQAGARQRLQLGSQWLNFEIVEVRDSMPGLVQADWFMVAPLAPFTAQEALRVQPNAAFVRGPAGLEDQLGAAVTSNAVGDLAVSSRHAWYAALQGSPLIAVVAAGFRVGMLVALVYATLSIITALTLTAARRTRDLAFLRPLGLSLGQSAGLTIVEHGLPVLLAIVPGIATGVAIAVLLEGSLGLEAFIGSGGAYRVELDWLAIGAIAAVLAGVVAASIAVSAWLSGRVKVVDALRTGEA
jgi:putative ABC transport system permease protein